MKNPRTPLVDTSVASKKTSPLHQRIVHSHNHSTKSATILKRIVIASAIGLAVAGGALGYMMLSGSSSVENPDARREAAKLVVENTTAPTLKSIDSTLGFKVTYDTKAYQATGQVTDASSDSNYISGMEYDGDDLRQARDYSIVKIKNATDADVFIAQHPELSIVTNIRKNYFADRQAVQSNQGKSNIEILTAETTASHKEAGFELSTKTDLRINDTEYVQLQFSSTNDRLGVKSTLVEQVYLTVQNDRPYTITVSSLNANNLPSASQYQAIIKTITYQAPDQTKLSKVSGAVTLASVELPKGTTNVPDELDEDTLITVVAKNQPAVVRVGTIRCANITIQSVDGSATRELKDACSGGIGSGSIVSSDGYIATNGHVARVGDAGLINGYVSMQEAASAQLSRLKQLLSTLVATGYLTLDNADSLVQGLNSGDGDAVAKVANLGSLVPTDRMSFAKDNYRYVIQTGNDPIRIDYQSDGTVDWARNKTNISASFVDANYDNSGTVTASEAMTSSQYSDVAILKATGSFPTIKLGSTSALEAGDKLTAIGYPAFVDGGASTTKTRTVPSATQGRVVRVLGSESNLRYTLIQTSVPIAQGNSGGPSFDENGLEIGLNTYGSIDCPDQKCFGDGTVRDIDDLKQLLRKNGITLKASSAISDTWDKGLSAMMAGEYGAAKKAFEQVEQQYPANYMAAKFLKVVTPKVSTVADVTPAFDVLPIVLGVIALFIVVLIVTVSLLVRHLLKSQKQPLATAPTPPAAALQAATPYQALTAVQTPDVVPAAVATTTSPVRPAADESTTSPDVASMESPAVTPEVHADKLIPSPAVQLPPEHMMPLVQPVSYARTHQPQPSTPTPQSAIDSTPPQQ